MLDNIELFIVGLAIFDCIAIGLIIRKEIKSAKQKEAAEVKNGS